MIKKLSLIFDDNPIARAYLYVFLKKNFSNIEIIYLGEKFLLPKNIISFFKFHRNNFYPIKFLKDKNIDYFLDQVEEFFLLEKKFLRKMYDFKNFNQFKKVIYIKNRSINSNELYNAVSINKNNLFLNSGRQILKGLLEINLKKFIHIHPAYLPNIRGADGSLHSIDKENNLGCTSFFMEKKIDSGKIIFRERYDYFKFKLKYLESYKTIDLYRLWFSFVDPIIRATHLIKLLTSKNLYLEQKKNYKQDIDNIKSLNNNYYTFMNLTQLETVFKKIFY